MRDNPILTLIKTGAFVVLAILVGLSFWQGTKWEDRMERLGERISKVESSTDRVNTTLAKLDRRIARGGVATTGSTGGGGGGDTSLPPPSEMGRFAWSKTAPEFLKGRAKDLWGAYGDNFFKPDPDWPAHPDLDDPKLDASGQINLWYGSAPPDLNPLTLSDGLVNRYIRVFTQDFWGLPQAQNPYLYKAGAAYRAEHSPDYKTWVFWVRPGIRWHTPQVDLAKYPHLKGDHYLTAHDWKFTMDLVMNPDVRAAHIRAYLADFERCEVVDDHCFIMHWKKASFTSISSNMNLIAPIPKFVYGYDENGKAFDPASIGSRYNEHWFGKELQVRRHRPVRTSRSTIRKEDDGHLRVRFADYWGDRPGHQAPCVMRDHQRTRRPRADRVRGRQASPTISYLASRTSRRSVQSLQ